MRRLSYKYMDRGNSKRLMVDLTHEMADLMSALGRPQTVRGRALMFVSAHSGEGVSTVAREYARCEAAFAKRPVWLIDADFKQQSQMNEIGHDPDRFGPPGELSQATPDGTVFFKMTPSGRDMNGTVVADEKFLVARPFLDKKLWVTRFRNQGLSPGQTARLLDQTTYWRSLRQHAQTIVVDVPAMDRGTAALQLATHMDGIILVVSEDNGDVQARIDLKNDLEQVGGKIIGMVYNRARRIAKAATQRPLKRTVGY